MRHFVGCGISSGNLLCFPLVDPLILKVLLYYPFSLVLRRYLRCALSLLCLVDRCPGTGRGLIQFNCFRCVFRHLCYPFSFTSSRCFLCDSRLTSFSSEFHLNSIARLLYNFSCSLFESLDLVFACKRSRCCVKGGMWVSACNTSIEAFYAPAMTRKQLVLYDFEFAS